MEIESSSKNVINNSLMEEGVMDGMGRETQLEEELFRVCLDRGLREVSELENGLAGSDEGK